MLIRTTALLLAASLLLAPAPTHATAQPPDRDEQELTPCQAAGQASVDRASNYLKAANSELDPLDFALGVGKACGVLLRGMKQLTEMSCPSEMIGQMREMHDSLIDQIDRINETRGYRISCFVPEFG